LRRRSFDPDKFTKIVAFGFARVLFIRCSISTVDVEIAMRLHESFSSEEFLRYVAECKRMAALAAPVGKPARRPATHVRSYALLPLGLAVLMNVAVIALN
jgi:hypothetical protein